MGLAISKQIFTEILAHSNQAAPIAACGYLISYVILSLQDTKPPIIKAFIIRKGQVAEEQVTIID